MFEILDKIEKQNKKDYEDEYKRAYMYGYHRAMLVRIMGEFPEVEKYIIENYLKEE